ncbi:hypothetical protein [Enterococcus sp. LJL90]
MKKMMLVAVTILGLGASGTVLASSMDVKGNDTVENVSLKKEQAKQMAQKDEDSTEAALTTEPTATNESESTEIDSEITEGDSTEAVATIEQSE